VEQAILTTPGNVILPENIAFCLHVGRDGGAEKGGLMVE
jgi:hypothetical protein